jgi:hypothetical protein
MSGKTCAKEAASLNSDMSKDNVWVESKVSPLGNLTLNGFCDLILLWHGALINMEIWCILNLLWPFHDVQEVVTVFILFAISYKCCPYTLFFVCLAPTHVFLFFCVTLVPTLGEIATLAGVALCNIVAMIPTIIF